MDKLSNEEEELARKYEKKRDEERERGGEKVAVTAESYPNPR